MTISGNPLRQILCLLVRFVAKQGLCLLVRFVAKQGLCRNNILKNKCSIVVCNKSCVTFALRF